MATVIRHMAAALALGLGLTLVQAPMASAEDAQGNAVASTTQGMHQATQHRGRGPRVHHVVPRHRHRGSGKYIAGGIAAGIAGALILNEVARSSGPSCGELEARCDRGQDWACRRLARDPRC